MKTPTNNYKFQLTSCKLRILLSAFCFLLSAFCFSSFAQNRNCYRINFSDKNNSPYSVNRPEEFLSQRAIAKRIRFNIPVIEQDLPVNPQYIESILNFSNEPSEIISKSKWDNSVVIFYPEMDNCQNIIAEMINHFSFVADTLPVGYYKLPLQLGKSRDEEMPTNLPKAETNLNSSCDYDYGPSIKNIRLHKGEMLHKSGFCGDGMLICVNDYGYENFNTIPYFQPLYENGQIWGTRDLALGLEDIYMGHSTWTDWGTANLSMMASTIEGKLVGSAPKANYFLFRTCIPFNNNLTNLAEEDFWAYAAEIADSLGADVMTGAISYCNNFDFDWQNIYTPADNNGEASIVSRALSILAQKGVVVVNAAGNEGLNTWKYILRPADAFNILAVGSVNTTGVVSTWSSFGPSADGRVKPDVAALGNGNWMVNSEGQIKADGIGTNAAASIIAGLSACLWQALPQYSALEIMQLIREYGDRYNNPDDRTGYGIPDFYQCYLDHYIEIGVMEHKISDILVYPNPTTGELRVTSYDSNKGINPLVEIFDIYGRKQKVESRISDIGQSEIIINTSALAAGIYIVKITANGNVYSQKIVKN